MKEKGIGSWGLLGKALHRRRENTFTSCGEDFSEVGEEREES